MQQHIGQMRSPRGGPKELHIRHEGKPGQRMPVAGVDRCESPDHALPSQPRQHLRVLGKIKRVVIIDELEPQRRPVEEQGQNGQQDGSVSHSKLVCVVFHVRLVRRGPR